MTDPTLTDAWPDAHSGTYYGRRVWDLGEDGDEGVMVQDHDRRAYAALCAHLRNQGVEPTNVRPRNLARRWASAFAETCGCTEEEHARHIEQDEDCECEYQLPPCRPEELGWVVEYADTPGAPALPVLVVTW